MSFTSLWYFPLLCMVAAVYYFLNTRVKPYFLLAVSWFMYGLFGLWHFALLLTVTVVSFSFGIMVRDRGKSRHVLIAAGIAAVAGILIYVKYSDMLLSWLEAGAEVFGRKLSFPEQNIILPVGISFYTFQAISYMIDVCRGGAREHSFVKYALYIGFFPQLVAGPIEQASWLLPQLEGRKAAAEDVSIGFRYLLSGCVRKFVIADYMAVLVDKTYGSVIEQSGASLFAATVLFAVQIYCDFSGYTHIAIGSARFLGIRLSENFNRPYLAEGCRDFWKRWHITLTKWFTEYVYIPLGGSRKGRKRKYFNIMTVFLLSGLWHGANLKFLLWGGFFGIWRIVEELAENHFVPKRRMRGKKKTGVIWLKRIAVFLLVCVSWVLFRSENVTEAAEVLRRIFVMEKGRGEILYGTELWGAAVRIGILALLPRILKLKGTGEKEVVNWYYVVTVLMFLISACLISIFHNNGGSSFIYFQF